MMTVIYLAFFSKQLPASYIRHSERENEMTFTHGNVLIDMKTTSGEKYIFKGTELTVHTDG